MKQLKENMQDSQKKKKTCKKVQQRRRHRRVQDDQWTIEISYQHLPLTSLIKWDCGEIVNIMTFVSIERIV
jgi:hypothetical protein